MEKHNIFHVAFPVSAMSKDRFASINSNLHVSDPEKDAINEKRGIEEYDPLLKGQPSVFYDLKPLQKFLPPKAAHVSG